MEPIEEASASLAPAPVFVDDTGRRRVLTRRAGRILVFGFTAYIGLVVVGFARHPRVGPIHLPTFGLPSLGLVAPPAPSVLREQSDRGDSVGDADRQAATGRAEERPADTASRRSRPAPDGPAVSGGAIRALDPPPSTSGGASPPEPDPVRPGSPLEPATTTTSTTTTTTRSPGKTTKPSTATSSTTATSTTTTSSTTTSSTTTSTSNPGQGSGKGTGPVAGRGPDGDGAPGQPRRTTTTTAG